MDKLFFICALFLFTLPAFAQDEEKRNLFYGNSAFEAEDYDGAIQYYQQAISHAPLSFRPHFNMGNAYLRKNDFEKAAEIYSSIVDLAPTDYDRSKIYHNLGNANLMNQKTDEAIEAYKSALRLNPKDEDTRYNLAYALEMKKEQEKNNPPPPDDPENPNDENNDENNENNNDENNNDPQENPADPQNGGNDPGEKDENEQPGNAEPDKISKEQARRILEAAYKREREVQKEIDKRKVIGTGAPAKKDW